MHVLLFERNLNFFHEFVPAAQLAWQDQHFSFEDYCLASLTTCHFYNLGHWPLTGVLCINRDDRSGSVQYGQHL